jgi:hypothetical protein
MLRKLIEKLKKKTNFQRKRQQFGAETSFQINAQKYKDRQKRAQGGVTASYGNVRKTKLNPNFKVKKNHKSKKDS